MAREVEPTAERRPRVRGQAQVRDQQEPAARGAEALHLPPGGVGRPAGVDVEARRDEALAHDPADLGLVVHQQDGGTGRRRLLRGELLEHDLVDLGRREGGLDRGRGVALVFVHLAREVQHQLFRVDAAGQHLPGEVPPAEPGGDGLREVEREVALAEPHQPLEERRDPLAHHELAPGPGGRPVERHAGHVPGVAGDDAAALEDHPGLPGGASSRPGSRSSGSRRRPAGSREGGGLRRTRSGSPLLRLTEHGVAQAREGRGLGDDLVGASPEGLLPHSRPAAPVKRTTADPGRRRLARSTIS